MQTTSLSLLDNLQGEHSPAAWERFAGVYLPLLRGWLRRAGVRADDADDVAQEVLAVVVRRMDDFSHSGRTGAFRSWLRTICVNCCRDFWKSRRLRPAAVGGSDFGAYLDQLADSNTEVAQAWEREHDLLVTRQLLDTIRGEFEPRTWEAFRRFGVSGESAATVAADLGITPNAVFIAKSRVLARLRELAAGLLD